ncbi:MAG: hypothetical protein WBF17_02875 [Phycisphaerae bacterium]
MSTAKSHGPAAGARTYAGLFMTTLAALMYEILLTRIFSVTMWYHFSFVAISVAMFGMTAGAIVVYLRPQAFRRERVEADLAWSCVAFAVAVVVSFLAHLLIHPAYELTAAGIASVILFYVVTAAPFVFSGICVCLALTRFPGQVGRLYAADLAGAAAGCVLLVYVMKITDGPTAVFVVSLFAGLAAGLFAARLPGSRVKRAAALWCVAVGGFATVNTLLAHDQRPLLRLWRVKGKIESRPLYEKWNCFSRITITGSTEDLRRPFGWGLSSVYPRDREVRLMWLVIDAGAGTVLTGYDGNTDGLEYLKHDVVNLAHWLRKDADTLVVGPGGGRDILSALVFEQKSVVGVEINEDILDAVNGRFGEYTGHLDRDPRVTFVNDEARSFVARCAEPLDIIQISLIDTWAATVAGAFVLTENSLYTVEAWETFLRRLRPNGILTVSRWYWSDRPGEVLRLAALAASSLKRIGAVDPRGHILLVKNVLAKEDDESPHGVGTILVSPTPFSAEDLAAVRTLCGKMRFEVVVGPESSIDPNFATLASGRDPEAVSDRLGMNVAAPTDDAPFFFHQLRWKDLLSREAWRQAAVHGNLQAVTVLGTLLVTVVFLTVLCLIVPLLSKADRNAVKGSGALLVFFAGIGMGFMLVEISQMQRLIVLLGHPTYGLSVVLLALLLSAGLGSYSTRWAPRAAPLRLLVLLGLLWAFGMWTPSIIQQFRASVTPVRIAVAIGVLLPLGLFMGMAFPVGMKLASARSPALTPWLWGVNGATSVCASVLAVVLALGFGISRAFWAGTGCYALAFLAFLWASRRQTASAA